MLSIKEIYKIGYGPSSSHSMAPRKAAQIFLDRNPSADKYKAWLYGSLAATGKGHQTDESIQKVFSGKEIEIIWKPEIFLPKHPNGLIFKAYKQDEEIDQYEVYSVGGGDFSETGKFSGTSIYKITHMEELLAWCSSEGKSMWEYVEEIEGPDVWNYLAEVWDIMQQAVKRGIENEGVLPGTLKLRRKASSYFVKSQNATGSQKNIGKIFAYALAVSEENAAGNLMVTAPTCGSCGVLPGILYFLKEHDQLSDAKILKALATAGIIGNFVKTNASISGAEVGCQGEVGTACAMAAGATTQLKGGSPNQIEYAAEMGFEHNLGLTCDPLQGYVQIPCIERNAFAAVKAWECAVYALLSDGVHKVSFDEVVDTMMQTGKDLQDAYKETSLGGLARFWRPKIDRN
ncbi:MAG: L-serine ammonia-lyase [Bacteroidetes bacterium]|nr:L-serine ammonia-lyase [Bacteroidota bacterium]